MSNDPKFRQTHGNDSAHSSETTHETASSAETVHFATVDEALRHDAALVEPPASLAERLNESIRHEPAPPDQSWWKRLFK